MSDRVSCTIEIGVRSPATSSLSSADVALGDALLGLTGRLLRFDGVATVCVFGWEEDADAIHARMLDRIRAELGGAES